jgi:hypothetical protein
VSPNIRHPSIRDEGISSPTELIGQAGSIFSKKIVAEAVEYSKTTVRKTIKNKNLGDTFFPLLLALPE